METKRLIIYGIGKFAEYVHYVFENDSSYNVEAFCIESNLFKELNRKDENLPLIDFNQVQGQFPPDDFDLFIAVGNNKIRKRIVQSARKKGYSLASYISTKASVWENLEYGENVFVDEGTMLQPFVKIGDSCILFACNIGHHTKIGHNCLISVVTTGGNVQIGNNSYIGMNSVIKQNVRIEKNNVIGMGCVISSDTMPGSVFTHKGTTKRSNSYDQIAARFLK